MWRMDSIPRMARPSYQAEMRHMLLWGLLAAQIDGSFSSIIVNKTFHASPLLGAVVWSTPMLAHMLSLVWGVVIRGRPKVRLYWVLAIGAAAATASIALTPRDWPPWDGWIFAAQIAVARVFMSGLVTVRTSIWRANYPPTHRARIAGRVQMLVSLQSIVVGAAVALLFDHDPDLYRWVYPVSAVLGLLALLPLRRLRIRGELGELRHYAQMQREAGTGRGLSGLRRDWREVGDILRRDRAFARYCTAQHFLGSANFLVDPVLNFVLVRELGMGYFTASLLMDQAPSLIALLCLSVWAGYFDRAGVLRFRVVNSAVWLSSILLACAALAVHAYAATGAIALTIGLLAGSRLINGLGRGGGAIAWNLGHLHFAGRHNAELYMSIHVGLTGLRGVLMPFVGALAYKYFGWASFLIAVASAVAALWLFVRLARDEAAPRDETDGRTPRDESPEPTELIEQG